MVSFKVPIQLYLSYFCAIIKTQYLRKEHIYCTRGWLMAVAKELKLYCNIKGIPWDF